MNWVETLIFNVFTYSTYWEFNESSEDYNGCLCVNCIGVMFDVVFLTNFLELSEIVKICEHDFQIIGYGKRFRTSLEERPRT